MTTGRVVGLGRRVVLADSERRTREQGGGQYSTAPAHQNRTAFHCMTTCSMDGRTIHCENATQGRQRRRGMPTERPEETCAHTYHRTQGDG